MALAKTQNKKDVMPKILFYDCEIVNSPAVHGWKNFEALGISVIGAYASWLPKADRLQAFKVDRFDQFQLLADQADEIVGFNSISFDDPLCLAHGIRVETTYDLMREVRRAAGEPISGPCTPGYNLAQLAQINLGATKTGLGKDVPDLWNGSPGRGIAQDKQRVIDYCLNDVELLRGLYYKRGRIKDPVRSQRVLKCDDNLIDWVTIVEEMFGAFGDRIFKVFSEDRYVGRDKTRALVYTVGVELFGCARVILPLFLWQKKSSKDYIGLPFYTPPNTQKQADADDADFDPLPF